jgi:hypothetical protein
MLVKEDRMIVEEVQNLSGVVEGVETLVGVAKILIQTPKFLPNS